MDPQRIYVLNGPNLDLLGEREPHIYGTQSLADVEQLCAQALSGRGIELIWRQTAAEHQMIAWLHEARRSLGIVINPAGFCYHSVPILDALRLCECRIVEVHISNIYRREEAWRAKSILAPAATGVITGLGVDGYRLALEYLLPPARLT
ncbi:MAG TPA: type II 3-dehydroquinate dehydratase [Steroidobacteraceae bacterium]|nr:type II 3-dehydroquinate dehydratase [Steroidobacteraceae bacterium]